MPGARGTTLAERVKRKVADAYRARLESMPEDSPFRQRIEHYMSWDAWLGELWPDAQRYMVLHEQGAPRPYHYRWLIPSVAAGDRRRWSAIAIGSMVGMVPAMRVLTGRWAPGLFVFGLPGVWATHRRCPPLVDAPAMFLAICAAAATRRRWWVPAVALSLMAGASKESAPVFASLYAGSPVPLVGMVAPVVRHLQEPGQDITNDYSHYVLEHPFEAGWAAHRGKAQDWKYWVAPWGGLVAGVAKPDLRSVLTVGLSYGQCLVATDGSRLFQWAWPVLAERTVEVAGDGWPLLLLFHSFNPWRGEGA